MKNTPFRIQLSAALVAALLIGGAAFLANSRPAASQVPASRPTPALELTGGPWLNTPGGAPIRLASRRGKVTIVHFWTFG